jgi:hypothetical protein
VPLQFLFSTNSLNCTTVFVGRTNPARRIECPPNRSLALVHAPVSVTPANKYVDNCRHFVIILREYRDCEVRYPMRQFQVVFIEDF